MINRLAIFFDRIFTRKKLLALLVVFSVSYIVTISIVTVNFLQEFPLVTNNDDYQSNFLKFHENKYDAILDGTTPLYFQTIEILYRMTGSVDVSFFLLNMVAIIGYIIIALRLVKKYARYDLYHVCLLAIFIFHFIYLKSYFRASNDTFMGLFIFIIVYQLILLFKGNRSYWRFIIAGSCVGAMVCTRPTFLLLCPLLFLITLFYFKQSRLKEALLRTTIALLCCMTIVLIFNWDSLQANGSLSFIDKNPTNGMNWTQKNYLGLDKMFNKGERLHEETNWGTTFDEVQEHLDRNGKDSLPTNLLEFVTHDTTLYAKLVLYNIARSLFELMRSFGLFIFLPLIIVFQKRFNFFLHAYFFQIVLVSAVCLTLVEVRWFIGYELFFFYGILCYFKNSKIAYINSLLSLSLILLTLFNIRTIVNAL
ncbi:MAG: glycosyltransferase family 39 protein [Nonlabens sp.]